MTPTRFPGGIERVEKYHGIYIVYTKEAETADRYIEKAVHRMGSEFDITVATSDNAEQVIILGAGAEKIFRVGPEGRGRRAEELSFGQITLRLLSEEGTGLLRIC